MSIITRMRKQTAVYWPVGSTNEYGQPVYGTPVEIEVRWEDKTEEFMDAEGETHMSKALVYVDREVDVGGVLLLGSLSSSVDQDDPKANDGAWEIRRYEALPNFKATEFLRTVYL